MKCELTRQPTCNLFNFEGVMISIPDVAEEFETRREFLRALYKLLNLKRRNYYETPY